MKYAAIGLVFLAAPLQAESMCGWTDAADIRAALAGDWQYAGGGSFVTASFEGQDGMQGKASIAQDGTIEIADVTFVVMPLLQPALGDVVYDVDQVDDILDTVEADWIADAVSITPCGPEDLAQLSAVYDEGPLLNGQLTLLPYATDQVVFIVEAEWRGDWGLAFVTIAGLMTPQ